MQQLEVRLVKIKSEFFSPLSFFVNTPFKVQTYEEPQGVLSKENSAKIKTWSVIG